LAYRIPTTEIAGYGKGNVTANNAAQNVEIPLYPKSSKPLYDRTRLPEFSQEALLAKMLLDKYLSIEMLEQKRLEELAASHYCV
jgi:membrane carboxypeptidase/penicillin-binding protein